ncbi:hypothetical protein BDN72DRAFT_837405 [Pluteus cervinus]|uniref:Uncharacterized protein n=1 Tax=Pluteus cervinus TaxID=181527 RepID=A0ACD3B167_9AGAR|nr:hypothetical protein BDN72DRAFT_837405 [Pluteus cervinus]
MECGLSWIWGIGFTTSLDDDDDFGQELSAFRHLRYATRLWFGFLLFIYPFATPFGLTSSSLDPSYRKGFGVDYHKVLGVDVRTYRPYGGVAVPSTCS